MKYPTKEKNCLGCI